MNEEQKRIAVAITGASGAMLGVRLVEVLKEAGMEVFLIWSDMGIKTLKIETGLDAAVVNAMADASFREGELSAPVASGSFLLDAMVILPCSMKTLAAVACGFSVNLITRTADVMIKEKRNLILGVRETPFSSIHLRNMLTLSECGVRIIPPCMGFYTKPETIGQMMDQYIGKIMDALQIRHNISCRWNGAEGGCFK